MELFFRSTLDLLKNAVGVLPIADLKIAVEVFFQVQLLIGYVTGYIKWLEMIKEFHGVIWHAFYPFAELGRFSPRHLRCHLVELPETASDDRPKLIVCLVGHYSWRNHIICTFLLLSKSAAPAGVWNDI
jgi:hypothetical protein